MTDVVSEGFPPKPAKRCYLGGPPYFALSMGLEIVRQAFGEMPYLVGSCLERPDYRDVDVRIIMEDDRYEALFGTSNCGMSMPFWALTMTAISEYLSKRTGLPIDFQVQKRSSVSEADWDKPREPLALFPINTGPKWRGDTEDEKP